MFRRSSQAYSVDLKVLQNLQATADSRNTGRKAVDSSPVFTYVDDPDLEIDNADSSNLDLGIDDECNLETDLTPKKSSQRKGRRCPTNVKLTPVFDEQLELALQRQVSPGHMSDWGQTLLRVAREYRSEVMSKCRPWKGWQPEAMYEARRSMYNIETHCWEAERTLVQFSKDPFDRGALRECFKMKELRGREFKHVHKDGQVQTLDAMEEFARKGRTCWVAKRYLDDKSFNLHKQDVAMQMVAKHHAEEFNRVRLAKRSSSAIPRAWRDAAKPVDFLMAHYIDFPYGGNAPCPSFSVEAFVYGKYDKYNTNSGLVAGCRKTPQAFSHFTFEFSKKSLICVDVQGVDDLYTDPAVHAPNKFLWCEANLGFRGMALFFWSHRCNDACRCMGLHQFPTYAECVEQKKTQTGATVSELAQGLLTADVSKLKDLQKGVKVTVIKLETLLSWPRVEQWMDIPKVHHPHHLSTVISPELVEPCIHMEMSWMYNSGRLTELGANQGEISPHGSLYHLQLAARGGLICALLALARLCSDFPHEDFLPMVNGHSVDLCLRLLEVAANNGSAHAAGSLAMLLEQGTYDDVDAAKAAEMYEQYAKISLEPKDNEQEVAYKDEDADGEHDAVADEHSLTGVARPTAWANCFGWDSHGLTPHGALAAAARLLESELPTSRSKVVELYQWASEIALEAGNMKLSMKWSERADELEEEEEDDFGLESEEEKDTEADEPMSDVKVPSRIIPRLEQLCKMLEKDSVGALVEHLLNDYSQEAAARRRSIGKGDVAASAKGFVPRSILKKTTFAKAVVEQVIPPSESSDSSDSDADMSDVQKTPMQSQSSTRCKRGSVVSPSVGPLDDPLGSLSAGFCLAEDVKEPRPPTPLEAQTSSARSQQIRVEVVDRLGKPLEGASIKVVDTNSTAAAVRTDSQGSASLERSHHAVLKVEKAGYAPVAKMIEIPRLVK